MQVPGGSRHGSLRRHAALAVHSVRQSWNWTSLGSVGLMPLAGAFSQPKCELGDVVVNGVAKYRLEVILDVVADSVVGLGASLESASVNKLFFERREEALRDRVVPASSDGAHARAKAVALHHLAVVRARVLGATIGVVNQPPLRSAPGEGHFQHR